MLNVLDLKLVEEAKMRLARFAPHVIRTPTLFRKYGGAQLFLKPESLQSIGAFKIRGAFNMMSTLPEGCPGVVAHSSGNHAQAVARAAKVLEMRAVIVMPDNAPALKMQRTKADGAEVIVVGPDSQERAERAEEIAKNEGLIPVPPYDHHLIAAGQGTAALELLEDVPKLDRFYAPISGGGLMAGCATVFKALSPNTEVIGVEPVGADDTKKSLAAGQRIAVPPPETIADGLRVRIPGEKTWPVIQSKVDRIETVNDAQLLDAMTYALSELRIMLEPSGAASLALALQERKGRAGVLLSGGNADATLVQNILISMKTLHA